MLPMLQTDEFRRVKIGVRRAGDAQDANAAVLAPFTGDEATLMAGAYEQAIVRLGGLVAPPQAVAGPTG